MEHESHMSPKLALGLIIASSILIILNTIIVFRNIKNSEYSFWASVLNILSSVLVIVVVIMAIRKNRKNDIEQ